MITVYSHIVSHQENAEENGDDPSRLPGGK